MYFPRHVLRLVSLAGLLVLAPAVADAAPSGLYALSTTANSISAYSIGAGGALTPVTGQTLTVTPRDLAFSSDGSSLYVAYSGPAGGGVLTLPVQADGGLGEPSDLPINGTPGRSVAVTPDGRFLYYGNEFGQVWGFSTEFGALTSVGIPRIIVDGDIEDIAINPDGNRLYAADAAHNEIQTFEIEGEGRLLGPVSTGATGMVSPNALTITRSPRRLVVGTSGSASAFNFDIGADGSLGAWDTTPYAGTGGGAVAASPLGPWTFVTDSAGPEVQTLGNDATGIDVDNFLMADVTSAGLAVTPDGGTVYARDTSYNVIRQFHVDADGLATEVSSVPVPPTDPIAGGLIIAPRPAPVAHFEVTPRGDAGFVIIDASSSHVERGTIARYAWDFGDGRSDDDGGMYPTKYYSAAGTYHIRLTVYDDLGCSTTPRYTGSSLSCGGREATYTFPVTLTQNELWSAAPVTAPDPAPVFNTDASTPAVAAAPPAPRLDGRVTGPVRATAAGRVRLPGLSAICPAGTGPCDHATVAIDATVRRQAVTLGKGTFRVEPGATSTVGVTLSSQGRRLLQAAGSLTVKVSILLRNSSSGTEARRTLSFRLLAP